MIVSANRANQERPTLKSGPFAFGETVFRVSATVATHSATQADETNTGGHLVDTKDGDQN